VIKVDEHNAQRNWDWLFSPKGTINESSCTTTQ
jgi:hypothetical protein